MENSKNIQLKVGGENGEIIKLHPMTTSTNVIIQKNSTNAHLNEWIDNVEVKITELQNKNNDNSSAMKLTNLSKFKLLNNQIELVIDDIVMENTQYY